jgi:dihydroorotate dehydrogenase
VPAWAALGFGFCEVGTVTSRPQPGNPRPRVWRLPDDRALVNRLGFNNDGAERTAQALAAWERRGLAHAIPLGVNIGKSRDVALEHAVEDHLRTLARLRAHADYVVVNVSSPNTPGLRALQERDRLRELLTALAGAREGTPLLVKIAPDLEPGAVDEIVDLVGEVGVDGLVVANTTTDRAGLRSPAASEAGGLSGAPLAARSTALVRRVARRADGLAVVGVGGVFTADDAWDKLAAGAHLVQVWTGLVYEGPLVARRICRGLLARMEREGVRSMDEIRGA